MKVHYTGGRVDPALATDHGRCDDAVRGVQNGHMDGNGWADIGYSMVVCPHGYVFMGRGPLVLPSANGAGLNSGHYAVLGLVGASGLTRPSDAMLNGIVDAVEYLRDKGNAGREIKGHRDGYATACPGDALYAWVRRGAPRPVTNWTERLVNELPEIRAGMTHTHVKTVRALLHARGFPPADLFSHTYAQNDEDLRGRINAFKKANGLAQDGIFGQKCWETALA
ncbi:peptidoglycan recognition family protein [Microtetraspora sp. NBRC 13810]|uniref:peptidoglycan recognition protein family protein n=1 Tax=Microtetraspora sp. NBRC 13810 TaxID=3030990 RepID=UPI0025537E22|nr:peptidoglycan recognition family protein [Microtetraspora sp. NBRC 13810]